MGRCIALRHQSDALLAQWHVLPMAGCVCLFRR